MPRPWAASGGGGVQGHLDPLRSDVAWMGLIADEKPEIAYLLDAASRTHGKGMQSYLTMMAIRLLEMRRVLKDTGSIYLRDPTASHYLKMLMDAVFGQAQFRNEIVWKRFNFHSGQAVPRSPILCGQRVPFSTAYIESKFSPLQTQRLEPSQQPRACIRISWHHKSLANDRG